jgi:hypothetical protein
MATRMRYGAICGLMGVVLLAAPAMADDTKAPQVRIAQVHSHPGGLTYGEWAVRWWQWVLETPARVNPIVDQTGSDCDEGQLGAVWFLAGTIGSGAVSRECTPPTDAALFFPLVNQFYGAFLNDPSEQRTEEFIRSQVDCGEPADLLLLELDGKAIDKLDRLFVESIGFDVGLPEDNLFGADGSTVPELRLSPSVSAGYDVFLFPLPEGRHRLRWQASWCSIEQDVTYDLTIGGSREPKR